MAVFNITGVKKLRSTAFYVPPSCELRLLDTPPDDRSEHSQHQTRRPRFLSGFLSRLQQLALAFRMRGT
jgi:hypothetical protein